VLDLQRIYTAIIGYDIEYLSTPILEGIHTMTTALATVTPNQIQPIISLVTNAVTSEHTRRAYGRALTEFLEWFQASGYTGFSKATVAAHVAYTARQWQASIVNQPAPDGNPQARPGSRRQWFD
jgi:hypothetical protein